MRKVIQNLGILVLALSGCPRSGLSPKNARRPEKLVDVVKGVPVSVDVLPGNAAATICIGLTKAEYLTPDDWIPITSNENQVYFVTNYSSQGIVLAAESLLKQEISNGNNEEIMVNGNFDDSGLFRMRTLFFGSNRFEFNEFNYQYNYNVR